MSGRGSRRSCTMVNCEGGNEVKPGKDFHLFWVLVKWYHQELAQGQGISVSKWWQSSKATITHVFLLVSLSVGFDVKQQLLVTLLKLL